ncbi:flagellar biosynthesis protein FlhF [Virgibacillus sp. W0181]|uniref:flagellar biosynthesis protein FlhF n=1 Tax=Virgibacillus sp. W0181 TaxID=3391581 RepID=UPI003F466DAE
MKVKKYVAETMPEAMNEIRKELGPDAVILNSRELKGNGFFGFFRKNRIEVVAALDSQPIQTTDNKKQFMPEKLLSDNELSKTNSDSTDVVSEIKQLKKMLQHQAFQSTNNYLPEYEVIYQYLLEQEIEDQYSKQLIDQVMEKYKSANATPSPVDILQTVRLEIEKALKNTSFAGSSDDKRVVQFVGPTGVGKTTTLAKVAAHRMLNEEKKIAFITADTYRIAAIEQLKTYARILNVPIEIAYSIEDYKNALQKFASYDLILVDTAGRNYLDERYVKELKRTIDFNEDMETYLVLSLTAKSNDITEIYDQFSHLSIKKIIFTKIDETHQYGNIVNMALRGYVEIAYLADGQNVPDDLIEPTPEKISELIIGRYNNE